MKSQRYKKSRYRTALHEAGHLGMALLLGMRVERCALIPREERWRPGELGRCTVLLPDPVGLRRFLLSLGGVMAENLLFGEDRGGWQDRQDALEALRNYGAHYEDPRRREELEELFQEIAEFFSRREFGHFLEESAQTLLREKILEHPRIEEMARSFPLSPEVFSIRQKLGSFEEPPERKPWKEWLLKSIQKCWHFLQRFRKPFEEDM